MAHEFHRRGEHVVGRLDTDERTILVSLLEQVHGLLARPRPRAGVDEFEEMLRDAGLARLGDELPGATPEEPDPRHRDPALDRLLPDAHRSDPLLSAEFRRMAGPGLRDRKAATIERAVAVLRQPAGGADGDEVLLDPHDANAMVVALTDLRLVVGERLALRTDEDADRLEAALESGTLDEATGWLVAVYDFLTWLQESLTQALLHGLPDDLPHLLPGDLAEDLPDDMPDDMPDGTAGEGH